VQLEDSMNVVQTSTDSTLEDSDDREEDLASLIGKLFAKLDLDVPVDLLEDPNIEETTKSNSGLVTFEEINAIAPFEASSCNIVTTRRSISNMRLKFEMNQQGLPFKWANMDVMFSTGIWVQPSPYNELYPFPSATETIQMSRVSSTATDFTLRFLNIYHPYPSVDSDVQEHLLKIEKLRQLCPKNHPGLILEILAVAQMYLEEEKYLEAGYWCRQILESPKSPGTKCHELLATTRILLSIALIEQDHMSEAIRELQIGHQYILGSSFIRNPDIIGASLLLGAGIAGYLEENHNKSESMFRQLAQLMLTTYGPRSEDAIYALQQLSEIMMLRGRYLESEELLRITMELSRTRFKSTDRAATELACCLAKLKYKQKRHKEAENLWRTIFENASMNWGSEDEITVEAEDGLALALEAQGRSAESAAVLRRSVEKLLRIRGMNSLTAASSMRRLASALMQDSRCEDAAIWWEKCVNIFRFRGGPTSERAFGALEQLLGCYIELGRYSGALKWAREWQQAVKESSGPSHEYVQLLESRIKTLIAQEGPSYQADEPMQLL
jgi:hypothetical protein